MSSVFFFTILAPVGLCLLIGQQEDLIQFLLNGGDTAGIPAFDDIFDLFGKLKFPLFYDFFSFDDIDGDVVVDKTQYIQIQCVNITLHFQNILFAHLIAAGILDNGNAAV